MNVIKESASPTEVTLNISMDSEDEEPFLSRSYRRLATRLQIPGFRRGKAPRSIVESHVGRSALVQEALEFMIPETLDQVLKDEDLQAFIDPQLELLEMEPVSFKAVVPLEPLVDLGNFRDIRVEQEPVEVTEEQVDEVLEHLRYESGPWEPVERPVQFGDLLSLDVSGTIQGEQAINDQGIDFIPQLDNQLPMPGFSVYLEGMSAGQEKDFTLSVPDDHRQAEYAGKECHFHVHVLSIKEKQLPDLDDEFAKGIRDGYESLQALRDFLRERLTEDAQSSAERQLQEKGLQQLMEVASVQASKLIYQRELDMMREERERALRNQRMDMDTYLSYIGKTDDEWQEQLRPQAEERLNTYLVLRKLAQEENIEVTPEELQSEIDSMITSAPESEDAMRRVLSSENARDSVRSSLLNRQVMSRLAQIVQGIENDSQQPEADAEEPQDELRSDPAQ
ncbi:MAG: trigger factor [Chloroflexi bacterium]|nr:trigger factor [Chloroflexota bacterium]MCH8348767.1 trigger factor [Chloroflexota bacterium]MCI0784684.1 trigger factor [Chloroflexota bacterium]MCI0791941.1 trigger factor [Chloroflexota bacterium]MCI0797170.1 trigger factor [Chloroflexota bacterium]